MRRCPLPAAALHRGAPRSFAGRKAGLLETAAQKLSGRRKDEDMVNILKA